jgi:hypothetical protein
MLKKNTLVTAPMFGGAPQVAALMGRLHDVVPVPITKAELTGGASGGARRAPGLFYGILNVSFAEFVGDYDVILVRRDPRDLLVSMAEGLARSRAASQDAIAQILKPLTTEQRLLTVLAGAKAARLKTFEHLLTGWYEWLLEGATPVAYEALFEKEGRAEIARMLRVSPAQVERAAAEILPDIEQDVCSLPGAWKDKFTIAVSAAYESVAFKAEGQLSVIPPVRLHKGKMQMVRAY